MAADGGAQQLGEHGFGGARLAHQHQPPVAGQGDDAPLYQRVIAIVFFPNGYTRPVHLQGLSSSGSEKKQPDGPGGELPVFRLGISNIPAAQGGQFVRVTLFRCGAQDRLFHKEFLASSCQGR